jgi:multisubunit Na+/H+ antiporter MnhE subunit
MEQISWQNIAVGLFMSLLSLHFVGRFFHFDEIKRVAFLKLAIYPFWLLARIYVDAVFLMRLILSDAKWGIMTADLKLENESLRIMLADSITLTPGSVYLERSGKKITLLCIGKKGKEGYPASEDDLRSIEKMLIRSEIPEKWEKVIKDLDTH